VSFRLLKALISSPQSTHFVSSKHTARLPKALISSPQSTHSSPQSTHFVSSKHTLRLLKALVLCHGREHCGLEIGEWYGDIAVDSSAQAAHSINGKQSYEDGTSPYHRGRGDSSEKVVRSNNYVLRGYPSSYSGWSIPAHPPAVEKCPKAGLGGGEIMGVHQVTTDTSGSGETITPSGSASPHAISSATICSTMV
jgi:hypothetical protein